MKIFRFEIQSCIEVSIKANNKTEARQRLINNLRDYADDMISEDTYVSDGVEK